MEYTVEELSPVKKKISVTVSPEEVAAAIGAAVAVYRDSAELDGFRKGKAPAAVVEKRFKEAIYQEAHDDLLNVHLNKVLQDLGVKPVSGIKMSGEEEPLKKGEPYSYTMEFEVMPTFDLPQYEGLEVDQADVKADDEAVDSILERLRRENSRLVPVEGTAPAQDGQIACIDFEAYLDGKPLSDIKSKNFELELGIHEALPEFEAFIKELPLGHTGEKVIHFPADFLEPSLADKDVTIKATVHAVKKRELPEVNDEFAKRLGKENVAELRAELAKAFEQGMKNLGQSAAQAELLQRLVKQTDFVVPESMVEQETVFLLGDYIERMRRMGKNPGSDDESFKKLKEQFRPDALNKAREKVLLMSVANKENLEVSTQELDREIVRAAMKMGENIKDYYNKLRETGMIFELRDNMLCDKAIDLIYERAKVNLVEKTRQEVEESEKAVEEDVAGKAESATGNISEEQGNSAASGEQAAKN